MTEREKFLLDLHGYLVIDDVVSERECDVAIEKIEANKKHASVNPYGVDTQNRMSMAFDVPNLGYPFVDLIDREPVLAVLTEIISPLLRLEYAYSFVYEKGAPPLQLHTGDYRDWQSYHYLIQHGRIHAGLCVVSFALQDISESSGGFVCVPGSHKRNFFLDAAEYGEVLDIDRPPTQAVPVKKGSALIFSEMLIHGARSWCEETPRYGLFYKFNHRANRHIHPQNMKISQTTIDGMTDAQRCYFNTPWLTGGPTESGRNVLPERRESTEGR